MWALTLTQPWAWMVIHGSKDEENRGWCNSIVEGLIASGKPFAVHAGRRMPRAEYERAVEYARTQDRFLVVPAPEFLVFGAVIGTAKISWTHTPFEWSPYRRWHLFGKCAWHLEERTPLRTPLFVAGKQGFWTVSDEAVAKAGGPLP